MTFELWLPLPFPSCCSWCQHSQVAGLMYRSEDAIPEWVLCWNWSPILDSNNWSFSSDLESLVLIISHDGVTIHWNLSDLRNQKSKVKVGSSWSRWENISLLCATLLASGNPCVPGLIANKSKSISPSPHGLPVVCVSSMLPASTTHSSMSAEIPHQVGCLIPGW